MFCGRIIRAPNGFIRSAIWHQSATSEEALIVLSCLSMAYPEHFDWLKEIVSFLPGKSRNWVSLHVGWNKKCKGTKMSYIHDQSCNWTCCSSLKSLNIIWTRCYKLHCKHCKWSVFYNWSCSLLSTNTSTGNERWNVCLCKHFWSQLNHLKEQDVERSSECKWDRIEQHTANKGRTNEAKNNRTKTLLMKAKE